MENNLYELQFALDTFYFLICGALVMWMAAGFAMLEAGLVRSKNTTEILTKNFALFSIACVMYLVVGYQIMYGGGWLLSGIETIDTDQVLADSAAEGFGGGSVYSAASDFFFQVVFVATAMSIVSGSSCICRNSHVYCVWRCSRADETMVIFSLYRSNDWVHLPHGRRMDLEW